MGCGASSCKANVPHCQAQRQAVAPSALSQDAPPADVMPLPPAYTPPPRYRRELSISGCVRAADYSTMTDSVPLRVEAGEKIHDAIARELKLSHSRYVLAARLGDEALDLEHTWEAAGIENDATVKVVVEGWRGWNREEEEEEAPTYCEEVLALCQVTGMDPKEGEELFEAAGKNLDTALDVFYGVEEIVLPPEDKSADLVRLWQSYLLFDVDQKGFITAGDLARVIDEVGSTGDISPAGMIGVADKDGDGVVSFKEFASLMVKHKLCRQL